MKSRKNANRTERYATTSEIPRCNYSSGFPSQPERGGKVSVEPASHQVPGKCISRGQTRSERQRRAGPAAEPPGKLENTPGPTTPAGLSSPIPFFSPYLKKNLQRQKKEKPTVTKGTVSGAPAGSSQADSQRQPGTNGGQEQMGAPAAGAPHPSLGTAGAPAAGRLHCIWGDPRSCVCLPRGPAAGAVESV